MADLAQKVKYTVEVDTAALDKLRLEINTGAIALENFEAQLKKAAAASKASASAFSSLTSKLQANTLSSARAELQMVDLAKAQAAGAKASSAMAGQVAELSASLKAVASASASATNAKNKDTEATKRNGQASDDAAKSATNHGMTFLKLFGKFQAAKWIVTELFDSIKSGAQQVDLENILGRQIGNYTKILNDAKASTAGIVSEGALRKSMALMSSFGIPMERFAESMELVQKMAIRTGQSAEFLTDSFGRAISRLSPLILDNLGIQVSLKEANEAYAASVGKSSDNLTKYEQKIGFMNMALEKMKANTEGVTFGGAGATVSRAEATLKNVWSEVEQLAAKGVWAWDVLGQGTRASAEDVLAYRTELMAAAKLSDKFYEDTAKYNPEMFAQYTREMEAQRDALSAMALVAKDPALEKIYEGVGAVGTRDSIDKAAGNDADYWRAVYERISQLTGRVDWTPMWDDWKTAATGAMTATYSEMNEQAKAGFKKLTQSFTGLLSEDQMKLLWGDYLKGANKVGRNIIKEATKAAEAQAAEHGGEFSSYVFKHIMRLGQESDLLTSVNVKMQARAVILAINAAISKDLNDKSAERLRIFEQEGVQHDRMRQLSEGATLAQVNLNEAKAREQELLQQIQKLLETRNETIAQGGDAKAIQAQLDVLAVQRDQAAVTRDMWTGAVNSQNAYFDGFKDKGKAAIQAEIDRRTVMLEQVNLRMLELHALALISGQMLGAKKEDLALFQEQAKDLEAKIARLKKGLSQGGGGTKADKKERDEFGDQDDLEKMLADWNAFELEVRQSAGKIREEAQAASDEARGLMFGLSNQNPQTSISPKEYEEVKKQWERVLELKNEFGTMIDMGLDEGAMSMLNTQFAELAGHFEKIANMADGMQKFADGLQSAFAGMEGLVGGEYVSMMGDLVQGFQGLSKAIGENANAYGMMNAVAPIMRAFTHNLIKDRKAQAAIEMLMQGAAAWAAAATGNVPAAVAHGISAGMYGMIAGGIIKLPKGKSAEDKPANDKNNKGAPRPDIHIYISGPIATTEAERGVMIRDALQAASRQGI